MIYDVTITDNHKIDFSPPTKAAEVIQNIRTIVSTPKYSVPLDRALGIDYSALDNPTQVAQAKLAEEIINAIADYEPRAEVTGITFSVNAEGIITPKVQVKLSEEP